MSFNVLVKILNYQSQKELYSNDDREIIRRNLRNDLEVTAKESASLISEFIDIINKS